MFHEQNQQDDSMLVLKYFEFIIIFFEDILHYLPGIVKSVNKKFKYR